jgi:hypothetical protein
MPASQLIGANTVNMELMCGPTRVEKAVKRFSSMLCELLTSFQGEFAPGVVGNGLNEGAYLYVY